MPRTVTSESGTDVHEKLDNSIKSHPEPTPVESEGGAAPSGHESADISAIANDIITEMPKVQEHAIRTESDQEQQKMAQYADLRDTDDNPFDPAIHKTNKSGEPTLSTKGKLIKKPGRKAKPVEDRQKSVIGGIEHQNAAPNESEVARITSRASGTAAANMLMQIGIVAGGDEWKPMKDDSLGLDEKTLLESAFADYFEATGKQDVPPGMALTIAITAYVLPRFTMPQTQSRLQRLKSWFAEKWANRKLRKHGLRAIKNGARDDSGTDVERKKHTGEKTG